MKFLKVMGLLAGFTFMFAGFNNATACDTKCETKKASNTKTEVKSKTDKAKVDNKNTKTATTAAKTEANK